MATNTSNDNQRIVGEITKDNEYQLQDYPLKKSEAISAVLDSLDTQQSRINSIKLINCKIKSLPEGAFVNFSALVFLNLSHNRLQALPQDFKTLVNIKQLDLSSNKFHAIPSALNQLTNLEKLSFRDNLLSEIPTDLGQKFERLRELDLSENKLVGGLAIEAVCHLPNLIQLFLQHNKISFLPQKIGKLKSLKVLKLNDNLLERLPGEIGELTALIELQLQENHLKQLPPTMGRLKKLRSLYLEFNSLQEMPANMANMTGLHLLFLHNNKLEQIPDVLKEPNFLKQLLRVSLDENPLPKEIARDIKQRGTIAFLSDQGGVLGISRRVRADRRLVAWGTASNLWDFVTDAGPDSESNTNQITLTRPDDARTISDPRMTVSTSLLDELGTVDFPTSRSDPAQLLSPRPSSPTPSGDSPVTIPSTPRATPRASDPPRSTRLYDPKRRSMQVRGAEMVKHNSADTVLTLRGFNSKTLEEYFNSAQNEDQNSVISPRASARRSVMVPTVTLPRPSSPSSASGSPASPTKKPHTPTGSDTVSPPPSPPITGRSPELRIPLDKLSNSTRSRDYSLSARDKAVSSDGYFKEKIPHFSAFKERYKQLLDERDFSQDRKKELNKLSTEEKWKFMKRYRGSTMDILTRIDDKTPKRSDEHAFFKPVETLASYFEGPINQKLRDTMILLRKVLNSENWDWISDFIDRGVSPLIGLIRRVSHFESHDKLHEKIHCEALECLDILIDYATENVLKGVDTDNVAFVLLGTLQTTESTVLLNKTFNILIKICEICSAGSGIALDGLNSFKAFHNNQGRFTPVLEVINRTRSIKLQASCFAFINWIIDSEDDVRIRYELRSELEEADIASLTDRLRATIEGEDEVQFEDQRIRSLSKKASTLHITKPSSPIAEESNSDEEDLILAKDDLLTQIEIFEEGFEMDFEEMEEKFQSVTKTRPRLNSSKDRNRDNLVVVCSTNLKLSIPYSAQTTYEQVFENIGREHEVPEDWSHYDLFLPETGAWLRNMGELPFVDKHGEILCELKVRTAKKKRKSKKAKKVVRQDQNLAEIFQLLLSSPTKDTQSSPRRESLTMSKSSPLKKSKKNNRMSLKLETDFKAPIRIMVEGPPGVCCALLLPPSFTITEVKRSALAALGNPLGGSKVASSTEVVETDVSELSEDILQQVGNIEKFFQLEVREDDKWVTLDESTQLGKCTLPNDKCIRLSLAPMNVTLNVDVEKPVVVRLTKKKKIDCNKTVAELIKYYCKSIPFDLEPHLYCLCVVYKSKPKDKVILRDSEPLVNQLTSIDMELMLIMKEDKSLIHEFKESKVPFWEDKTVAEFDPESDTAEAATLNQLIYSLICNIEKPFPEPFALLFISTLHSFTTVPMFFKKLEEFITNIPKKAGSEAKHAYYERLEEFIKLWASTSPKDFSNFPAAFDKFLGCIDDKLGKRWDKIVIDAKQAYKAQKEIGPSVSDFKLLRRQTFRGPLSISDIDESQFAQHLTVQAFAIFRRIQPSEWIEQGWTGPKYKKKSKNIVSLIDHYNEVSQWVTSIILTQNRIRSRVSILNYFIRVAFQLKLLNNYHTLGAIIAGLNSSNVLRLKYTFEKLPSRSKTMLRDLEQLMTMMQNFRNYRKAVKDVKGPTIPYLAVHLKDLLTISENNPDMAEEERINWTKRKLYYQVVEEMAVYKRTPYELSTIKEVDSVLSRLPKYSEQELYALSLKCEPQNAARANIL